jgi:hypothetical protein
METPQEEAAAAPPEAAPTPDLDPADQPLPIPPGASSPPVRYHAASQLPSGVYRRGVAVALNQGATAASLLPPAPPMLYAHPIAVATAPDPKPEPAPEPATPDPVVEIALGFNAFEPKPDPEPARPAMIANPMQRLFEGGNDSLVAIAVGSAEGTRTPSGEITDAYFGHTDPGNRVWNMGTFSYQHGASTPEEANQKQLKRLQSQSEYLRSRAAKYGLNLTLEEMLNGIDLANQSPLAALGRMGYIERLAEAKQNGHEGADAIVVARTRSYINPDTQRWNAPGLGNTQASITRDQQRRANAVASAIAAYQGSHPDLTAMTWQMEPNPEAEPPAPTDKVDKANDPDSPPEIFQVWTDEDDPQPDQAERSGETPEVTDTEQPEADVATAIAAAPEDIAPSPALGDRTARARSLALEASAKPDKPSPAALLVREGGSSVAADDSTAASEATATAPTPTTAEPPAQLPEPSAESAPQPSTPPEPAPSPLAVAPQSLTIDQDVFEMPGALPDSHYYPPLGIDQSPLSFEVETDDHDNSAGVREANLPPSSQKSSATKPSPQVLPEPMR